MRTLPGVGVVVIGESVYPNPGVVKPGVVASKYCGSCLPRPLFLRVFPLSINNYYILPLVCIEKDFCLFTYSSELGHD